MGEKNKITGMVTEEKMRVHQDIDRVEGEKSKEKKLVMLVDDEQSILIVGERMLNFLGFDVLTAADGRESLKLFKEHADEIDCVLLDLGLPNIGGEEVFGSIRRIRPDVKIILCSGQPEQDATEKFDKTERLDGFLQKPFTLAILEKKLASLMHIGN